AACRVVLRDVFHDDWPACPAHDHRHGRAGGPDAAGAARPLHPGELRRYRINGSVLALRGHRLDLPVSAALPGGAAALTRRGIMAQHVVPRRVYYAVFAALILLTLLTIGAASLELGDWHTPVGLVIAVTKATLVLLFFMHIWYSTRLTWV